VHAALANYHDHQDLIDRASRALYTEEDRRRGELVAPDRQGQVRAYPFVTLSIGVVTSQNRSLTSSEEVSRVAAEVKRKAKELAGSVYFVDRRASN
jgi:hypothetical protein